MRKISLSRCYNGADLEEAVLRAVRSGQYILGPECAAFEKELAASTGVAHAVLGSSWTMIVYLWHRVMNVRPGDEVIVPSHTAFPTIEPLLHCEAVPVFVEVDDTFCMDPEAVAAAITPRTVGLIPVHLYGHPASLEQLKGLADQNGLWMLEDCAQSQGARYKKNVVGSIGTASALSFFPSKNLTVLGDGGCLLTNDGAVAEKLRMWRNHGRRDKYTHEFAGFNIRFNEIQAAVGRVMLRHLDRFNENRRLIASRYNERLGALVKTPLARPWVEHVYHMYVVRAERRDPLAAFLRENGIETGIHYPVANHQQPAITARFASLPRLENTEKLVGEILSLPIHGEMSLEEADCVCDAIEAFYLR